MENGSKDLMNYSIFVKKTYGWAKKLSKNSNKIQEPRTK